MRNGMVRWFGFGCLLSNKERVVGDDVSRQSTGSGTMRTHVP
jgi:hypothetical protein